MNILGLYTDINIFLRASLVVQTVKKKICLHCWRPVFNPWIGKNPWRMNGYPLQYSCLENPMDRGVCRATVHGVI